MEKHLFSFRKEIHHILSELWPSLLFFLPLRTSEKAMGAMKDTFIREALYQQGLMIQGKSEAHGTDGRS